MNGLMCDFMDWKVGRWRKTSSLLGHELDSPADLIPFPRCPSSWASEHTRIFICCGLARLARVNATVALVPKDATGEDRYFEGLPIPSSLGLVAILSYLGQPGSCGDVHPVSIIVDLWAVAMVSEALRVPKI
ncbi:hypothetical protein SCLCIDRAFT_1016082 [Scleroderma citrinum Foug A]|uniref:Uncharacterized protein n=1 Tax=Scleroderma citrinum Foug A TaxID=1036808 RepID=A0A0C3A3P5_9AGAM|nr:hypothetical protein SCLCIDRAFT_1016082 [Scleroderma citrinum Foug A]